MIPTLAGAQNFTGATKNDIIFTIIFPGVN